MPSLQNVGLVAGKLSPNLPRMEKLKVLALHGFRTSGQILKTQVSKWPESVLNRLEIHYLDAPFPAQGKSDVEDLYPPPYYEWYQYDSDSGKYINVEECFVFIEDYMLRHGPFHGLLGFSRGAHICAALSGLKEKGMGLGNVPQLSFVIIISGAKFKPSHPLHTVYSPEILCPSIHFIGDKDFLKTQGEDLITAFVDPVVIRHPAPHTVPRLDTEAVETLRRFLDSIEQTIIGDGQYKAVDHRKHENIQDEEPAQYHTDDIPSSSRG